MGSVKIDRFDHNLKALDVKKKEWTNIRKLHARALLEAHDTVLRAYYETLYSMQVKPRKCIIDTMSHRMSMCRRNSRNAQDMTIRETIGNRQKAIRMRVDG